MVHSPRVQSVLVGRSWWYELEAAGWLQPEAECDKRVCSFPFSSRNAVLYTVRVLTSITLGQVVPCRHAQRSLVEMMLVLNN